MSGWDEEDEARLPFPRAVRETEVILRHADEAYRPYSCPASGECCQLAKRQREPWLWPAEWDIVQRAARKLHNGALPPDREDGGCPFLDESGLRCTVYAARPFGCRTFFCERKMGPKREPVDQVIALSKRLEHVAQRADPEVSGPRPLREWLGRSR